MRLPNRRSSHSRAVAGVLLCAAALVPAPAQAFFCFSFSIGGGPNYTFWNPTPNPFSSNWYGPTVGPHPFAGQSGIPGFGGSPLGGFPGGGFPVSGFPGSGFPGSGFPAGGFSPWQSPWTNAYSSPWSSLGGSPWGTGLGGMPGYGLGGYPGLGMPWGGMPMGVPSAW